MFEDTHRRRFLQLAGTGTALSIAGCNGLSDMDGETGSEGAAQTEGSGDVEESTVTLGVQPDQESVQELQSEIRSEVESGELDQMEAQEEFQRRQTELTADAVDQFRNRTEDGSVAVDDTVDEFGVLLVSGAPSSLIEVLAYDEVSGLFPASIFEEAQAQSGGAGAAPTGNSTATGTE